MWKLCQPNAGGRGSLLKWIDMVFSSQTIHEWNESEKSSVSTRTLTQGTNKLLLCKTFRMVYQGIRKLLLFATTKSLGQIGHGRSNSFLLRRHKPNFFNNPTCPTPCIHKGWVLLAGTREALEHQGKGDRTFSLCWTRTRILCSNYTRFRPLDPRCLRDLNMPSKRYPVKRSKQLVWQKWNRNYF